MVDRKSCPGEGAPQHIHHHAHCHHGHGESAVRHGFADPEALTKVFDDPSRDEWQRPEDILEAMGLKPNMVVADVGAGTGYFATRLARAIPLGRVIATDLEPAMVRFLTERARREQLPQISTVLATNAASGLAASSVDRILVVHVGHHLAHRRDYLRDLATALKPDGRLFIVEYSPGAQQGPPAEMRISPDEVVRELEGAGLAARLSPIALPDQYIVEATGRLTPSPIGR